MASVSSFNAAPTAIAFLIIDHTPTAIEPISTRKIRHLLSYLALGFVPQETPSSGLLCALYALEGSLKAAREVQEGGYGEHINHVTMNDLLGILFGEDKMTVAGLENGGSQGASFLSLPSQNEGDDDLEDSNSESEASENEHNRFEGMRGLVEWTRNRETTEELDIFRGEMLTNIQRAPDYENGWLIGTNFRGETGVFPRNFVTLTRRGLGEQYLRAVELHLHDQITATSGYEEEDIDATINQIRQEYLHFDNLEASQILLILKAVNMHLGTHYRLGIVQSRYRGRYLVPEHIVAWENEVRKINKAPNLFFPFNPNVHTWDSGFVQPTITLVDADDAADNGPLVWIHNNGIGPKVKAHTRREGMAHWFMMSPDASAEGREMVGTWDLESLVRPILVEDSEGQVFRIMNDCMVGQHALKRGHFVYRASPSEVEGEESQNREDGIRYLWVENCDKQRSGWIHNEHLEPVERVWNGGIIPASPVVQPPPAVNPVGVDGGNGVDNAPQQQQQHNQ